MDYSYCRDPAKIRSENYGTIPKELINYGYFSANLDLDIKSTGNFKDEEDINAKGLVILNDFHLGKYPGDDYASCDKMVLKIDEMSPKNHQYNFDSLSLTHPFLNMSVMII